MSSLSAEADVYAQKRVISSVMASDLCTDIMKVSNPEHGGGTFFIVRRKKENER